MIYVYMYKICAIYVQYMCICIIHVHPVLFIGSKTKPKTDYFNRIKKKYFFVLILRQNAVS